MTEILLDRPAGQDEVQLLDDELLSESVVTAETAEDLFAAVQERVEAHYVSDAEKARLERLRFQVSRGVDYFEGYFKGDDDQVRLESLYLGAAAYGWKDIGLKAYGFLTLSSDDKTELDKHLYRELGGLKTAERECYGTYKNDFRDNLDEEQRRIYPGRDLTRRLRKFGRWVLEV